MENLNDEELRPLHQRMREANRLYYEQQGKPEEYQRLLKQYGGDKSS